MKTDVKTEVKTAVLIVGGGPAGLMAASLLAAHEVDFRIVDKKAEFSENSRALVIQPRTLELLEQMGIVADFLAKGRKVRGATLYEEKGSTDLNIYSAGEDQTRYNFGLMLEQTYTEKLLYHQVQKEGYTLEWSTELTGLEQTKDGVTVTLKRNDVAETVHARYIVAADGASSTVRRCLNVPFTGKTAEQRFMVMDAAVDDFSEETMGFNVNAHGDVALFPLSTKGRYRIISTLPPGFDDKDPTVEDFQRFVKENFPGGLELRDPAWFSPYRIHSRSVKSMKAGHVFFVGDAAHVHTPVGGQGMNTGLQDAYNLAWKLALVLRNTLPEDVLETYHTERHPVAMKLIKTSDRVFEAVSEDAWTARFIRTHVFAPTVKFATSLPHAQERVFPIIGMTGVHYDKGFFIKDRERGFPKNAPEPGERFPYLILTAEQTELSSYTLLDYAQHTLFVFTSEMSCALQAEMRRLEQRYPLKAHIVTTAEQPGTLQSAADTFATFQKPQQRTSAYLVRPDTYLALRQGQNKLQPSLTQYFGGGRTH